MEKGANEVESSTSLRASVSITHTFEAVECLSQQGLGDSSFVLPQRGFASKPWVGRRHDCLPRVEFGNRVNPTVGCGSWSRWTDVRGITDATHRGVVWDATYSQGSSCLATVGICGVIPLG